MRPDEPAADHAFAGGTPAFGDYRILREIGRGGMGVVYEAHQTNLDRRVALKVLHGGLGLSSTTVARFQREAQAAARLHHPNIVPIFDQGEFRGNYYYAMELIEGHSLDRLVKAARGGYQPDGDPADVSPSGRIHAQTNNWRSLKRSREWYLQLARMLAEVGDGLHYAHTQGVVHRDIKPHNLIVSIENRVCITDFGLARVAEEPGVTLSGEMVGSPLYMSPEQISGGHDDVTPSSDIYSFGTTLYEVLAGRSPFEARSREQVISKIMSEDAPPLRRLNADVPYDLETICQKAIHKNREARYATADAMAADLRRFANGERIRARRPGVVARSMRFVGRHKAGVAVTAAALLLVFASVYGVLSLRRGRQDIDEAREAVAQQAKVQEAEAIASQGEEAIEAGDYSKAFPLLEAAIKMGAVKQGGELLARAYAARGEFEAAIQLAEVLLESQPESPALHGVLAEAYQSKDPERARQHQRELRSLDPDSPETRYVEALSAPNLRGQLESLDALLQDDPFHDRALETRAVLKFERGDYASMNEDAQRLVALRARDGYAWAILGASALLTDNAIAAAQAFSRAMSLGSNDARVFQMRARAYLLNGQFADAVSDATRAIELGSERESPIPKQLLQLPEFSAGPEGGGIGIGPEDGFTSGRAMNAQSFAIRAEAHLRLGQWNEVILDCDRAIELGNRAPTVYVLRAAARSKMELPALALRDVQEAVRRGANPEDADLKAFAAALRAELGLEEGEEAPQPF